LKSPAAVVLTFPIEFAKHFPIEVYEENESAAWALSARLRLARRLFKVIKKAVA